ESQMSPVPDPEMASKQRQFVFEHLDPMLIVPNPDQVRVETSASPALIESVSRHGVLQPVVVYRNGELFTLLMGHRRRLASIAAGLTSIPCLVYQGAEPITRDEAILILLEENAHRSDLTPLEKARSWVTVAKEKNYRSKKAIETGFGISWATY